MANLMDMRTQGRVTYDDYAKLPEGSGYELISGRIVKEPAPGTTHQRVVARLGTAMRNFVTARNLGEVLFAPIDVYLMETETYQPDIVFIRNSRLHIIGEQRIEGAPDVVVEVLSPSTAYYDLVHKKKLYEDSEVPEYWVVDPLEKTVEVFGLVSGAFVLRADSRNNNMVQSLQLSGFAVDHVALFKGL